MVIRIHFLVLLIFLFSCGTKEGSNEISKKEKHQSIQNDQEYYFDTTINFYQNFSVIDSIEIIKGKELNIIATKIDTIIKLSKEFWQTNISVLPYLNDSVFTKLDYVEDEGNRYFLLSKTDLNKINLILFAFNSFNADMIDGCALLVTNKQNVPIFFTHVGEVGFNKNPFINYIVSDSIISIYQIGEKYSDGFKDSNSLEIRFNHKESKIEYNRFYKSREIEE